MLQGFEFAGVHSSAFFDVLKIRRAMMPTLSHRTIQVDGRPGAYDVGVDEGMAKFDVDVLLTSADTYDLQEHIRLINDWLYTDDLAVLRFDHEPDKYYNARLTDGTELDSLGSAAFVTLSFVAPDPYARGATQTQTLASEGTSIVYNGGNAEAFPILRATANKSITSLALIKNDKYVALGTPEDVELPAVPAEETLLNDGLESTNGWSTTSYTDGGSGTGTMLSNGQGFIVDDYGTGSGWHGPARVKALSSTAKDFRVTANFTVRSSSPDQVGRVELYVLDANGSILGKIAMKDATPSEEKNQGEIRVGNLTSGRYLMKGDRKGAKYAWNDMNNGQLWIERRGNKWRGYFGKRMANGKFNAQQTTNWYTDKNGTWSANAAQVVLHIAAYADKPTPVLAFGHVSVKRYNDTTPAEIPIMAEAGDVLEIDFDRQVVYKNDVEYMEWYDPLSDFFALAPGENTIKHAPADDVTCEIEYEERWR